MTINISEELPARKNAPAVAAKSSAKKGDAKGGTPQENSAKRIRQAVYDIRYRARREDIDLRKAYSEYMSNSNLSAQEKTAVREKLFGKQGGVSEQYMVTSVDWAEKNFTEAYHKVFFEELYRIIIPNGYCILWAFNPFSFAGLRNLVGFENNFPWNGNFISLSYCQNILKEKGFVIEEAKIFNYQPIFFDKKNIYISLFESIGDRWFPLLGNIYCIVARKDVPGLTPIKPNWKNQRKTRVVGNKI